MKRLTKNIVPANKSDKNIWKEFLTIVEKYDIHQHQRCIEILQLLDSKGYNVTEYLLELRKN